MGQKVRLDRLLLEKGLARSRERAKALILSGQVLVNKKIVDKAGTLVNKTSLIELKSSDHPYVSRGGIKLEAAIKEFKINVKDKVALDVGASTGGFTDCLLKHGAKKVYAVDVGYGLLDWQLRQDKRVTVIERQNIRYLPKEKIPEPIDIVTIDVSFISVKKVIPKIIEFLRKNGEIIVLIKPQFEVGKNKVGKGGIVRDEKLQRKAVSEILEFCQKIGLQVIGVIPSPILGAKGNQEYLAYIKGGKNA
ncbi:MAG TPA: TlyA family RNA methyltransferase [Candidatus Desulfofervidus auxilii]|uniref:TlyA family RNA methyltransferase n=1 Tax=Desulfofervidus auxilii TaxID=1621989 RepID=A0A7V0NEW6_DESA2|nr:TlyA family RNA methyltransferase [Candidatus Desulfofervidus auxilii]